MMKLTGLAATPLTLDQAVSTALFMASNVLDTAFFMESNVLVTVVLTELTALDAVEEIVVHTPEIVELIAFQMVDTTVDTAVNTVVMTFLTALT